MSTTCSISSSLPLLTLRNPKNTITSTFTPTNNEIPKSTLHIRSTTADNKHNGISVNISRRDAILFGLVSFPFLQLSPAAGASVTDEEKTSEECTLTVAPSGLAFCDQVIGTGAAAMKGQLIKAHYIGKLENGKVFDSSYPRGRPLAFRVGIGEVIKGWDLGILGSDGVPPMLAGGKRTLKLPPELGYGVRGAGCKGGSCVIPPDSTLLFDVEFIG